MRKTIDDLFRDLQDAAREAGVTALVLGMLEGDDGTVTRKVAGGMVGTPSDCVEIAARMMGSARGRLDTHISDLERSARWGEGK